MPIGSQRHHRSYVVPLIVVSLLFLSALGFGVWAFAGMQDYKNNVNSKIETASAKVKQQTSVEKDKEFAEKEKNPLKRYKGPDTYGGVDIEYPKTCSAYVEQGTGSNPLTAYFHPNYVPGVLSGTAYALRIQVVNSSYDKELKSLEPKVNSGKVKTTPFRAAKVPSVLGTRADGKSTQAKKTLGFIYNFVIRH